MPKPATGFVPEKQASRDRAHIHLGDIPSSLRQLDSSGPAEMK